MAMINLERQDLLQLDPISHTGTLKLLPLGKKNKQKLVVGDDSGQLSCFEFKRGEPQPVFQAKAFDGPISCIALGGNPLKRDKIFAANTQRLVGITKKGKEFFRLATSLSESINNMAVEETRIWTSCEYVYNLYDNGKDAAYFLSRDKINCMVIDHLLRDSDFDTLLGCQDNCLRLIQNSSLTLEVPMPSPVSAMTSMSGDNPQFRRGPAHVSVGLSTGAVSLMQIRPNSKYSCVWSLEDSKRSSITCMKAFDLTKDGIPEIIVGREDGRVEVLVQDKEFPQAEVRFSRNMGESIRSIECGVVNTVDCVEVVVAAYSGKVVSFTSEPVLQRAQEDTYGRSVHTVNNENRMKFMKKELDGLRQKIEKEKEKMRKITAKSSATTTSIQKAPLDFSIIHQFSLDSEQAAYVLTIELQTPLDLVVVRSSVSIEIVESDIGSTVVSLTPPHLLVTSPTETVDSKFVATFRCQGQEKRMSITLRSAEGEYGDLNLTVVAATTPKAAKQLRLPLRPLSLHAKLHELTAEQRQRPRNRVKFTGNAAMILLHEWVQALFPDIPPNLDEAATEQTYLFKNSFTGAVTLCEFRRNEIIVESESASVVAIAKETITRLANFRRIQLEETLSPQEASISSFLTLVRERLEYQLSLARKMELLDALQEITMQEPDLSWLSPEYAEIIKDPETIRKEFKLRTKSLEYLTGIITDLFVDWNRLLGTDARHRIPDLQQVILSTEFSFDALVAAFLPQTRGKAAAGGGPARK